jgi:Flp pilus assembly protein TadD
MFKRSIHIVLPRLALGLCLAAMAFCLCSGQAALAQNQSPEEPRYCTWLFWSKKPALITQALERLAQGDPFMVVAREVARKHPKDSQANADCMRASGMDPAVLAVVKQLKIGEISRPFDLGGGTALVMRTTDQHRRKAQELYSKGRYSQAERELLRDLKLHPASAAAWHMLALTRTAQGNYKHALTALNKALVWSPGNPAMLNDKASALANLGRYKQAVPVFEKALELDPKNPTIMSNLAWALTLAGKKPKRAEALAKQACQEAPKEARFWHTLGKVQAAQGHQGKALVSFRQALILAPKNKLVSQDLIKTIKAMDPKMLARLGQAAPSPAAKPASKPAPKPAPKASPKPETKDKDTGMGLKPAPDLRGEPIALPSHWPALPKSKAATEEKAEAKSAAVHKDQTERQAKTKPEAKPPAKPSSQARGRVVSLPMPKFTERPSSAPDKAEEEKPPLKDKAAAKPAPAEAEKPEPKAAEAEPAPARPEPEKAKEPKVKTPEVKAAEAETEPGKPETLAQNKSEESKAKTPEAEVKMADTAPDKKTAPAQAGAKETGAKPDAEPKPDEAKAAAAKAKPEPKPKEPVKKKVSEVTPEPDKDAAQIVEAEAANAKPSPAPKDDKVKAAATKPTPVKAEKKTSPEPLKKAAISKPHYLIQVASYRPEALAQKELRAWKRRNIPGRIEKWQDKRGRNWHRVLLGPYAGQKEAEKKAKALKAKRLVRDYYVVKRPAD